MASSVPLATNSRCTGEASAVPGSRDSTRPSPAKAVLRAPNPLELSPCSPRKRAAVSPAGDDAASARASARPPRRTPCGASSPVKGRGAAVRPRTRAGAHSYPRAAGSSPRPRLRCRRQAGSHASRWRRCGCTSSPRRGAWESPTASKRVQGAAAQLAFSQVSWLSGSAGSALVERVTIAMRGSRSCRRRLHVQPAVALLFQLQGQLVAAGLARSGRRTARARGPARCSRAGAGSG